MDKQEKLDLLISSAIGNVTMRKEQAEEELQRRLSEELAAETARLEEEMKQRRSRRCDTIRAEHRHALQKDLHQRRLTFVNGYLGMIEELFAGVRERLAAFTASEEYEAYLHRLIAEGQEKLGGKATVILCERDRRFADTFGAEISDEDFLGGVILRDGEKGMQLNLSFLSKLEEEKDSFWQNYDFKPEG